jgi:hypothetical protein
MNDQTLAEYLRNHVPWDVRKAINERLEGTSPAGPPSESGCGDAERRNSQRPTDIPHGSAVVEAKDGVALDELEAHLRAQAADWDQARERVLAWDSSLNETVCADYAAEKRRWIGALARLRGLPRTQSGEEEVEECQVCRDMELKNP